MLFRSASSQTCLFHRASLRDSAQIVTPFVRAMKRKGEPATCLMHSSTAMSLPRPTAGQPKATFAVEVTLSTIYILLILSDHPIHIGQAE